jgi:protein ImuA
MRTSVSLPVLTALRERIQRLEGGAARPRTVLPFGIKAIDQHLPEGGLALGALHEVAGGGNGAIDGAAAALFTAGIAARTSRLFATTTARERLTTAAPAAPAPDQKTPPAGQAEGARSIQGRFSTCRTAKRRS